MSNHLVTAICRVDPLISLKVLYSVIFYSVWLSELQLTSQNCSHKRLTQSIALVWL